MSTLELEKLVDNIARDAYDTQYGASHTREAQKRIADANKARREEVLIEYPEAQGDGSVIWRVVSFGTREGATRWLARQAFKGAREV